MKEEIKLGIFLAKKNRHIVEAFGRKRDTLVLRKETTCGWVQ